MIEKVKISDIDKFKNHPFLVEKDESLMELANSIRENGLLNPVIIRKNNERYEMISGHRRMEAMLLNGEEYIDAYIKELNDDEATIFMVDSNMQRERILPSEKAFAYKMRLDAIKHQGETTCATEGHKTKSRDLIAKQYGESGENIRKYIRLTYLIPELLEFVDNKVKINDTHQVTMGIKPAVELSYLNKDEQKLLYSIMTYDDLSPNHAQAIRIRDLSKRKKLNSDVLEDILMEEKGNQHEKITFNKEKIVNVLPYDLARRDKRYIEAYIIKAIEAYKELDYERGDSYDLEL